MERTGSIASPRILHCSKCALSELINSCHCGSLTGREVSTTATAPTHTFPFLTIRNLELRSTSRRRAASIPSLLDTPRRSRSRKKPPKIFDHFHSRSPVGWKGSRAHTRILAAQRDPRPDIKTTAKQILTTADLEEISLAVNEMCCSRQFG